MRVFAVLIEDALYVAVQRSHDADPRKHRWPVPLDHQHQGLDRGLPFGENRFPFRQASDVVTRVPQRDQRSPVRQGDCIVEFALPTLLTNLPAPADCSDRLGVSAMGFRYLSLATTFLATSRIDPAIRLRRLLCW
jgi:hypothetical protein